MLIKLVGWASKRKESFLFFLNKTPKNERESERKREREKVKRKNNKMSWSIDQPNGKSKEKAERRRKKPKPKTGEKMKKMNSVFANQCAPNWLGRSMIG